MAIGYDNILTSPDGVTWTERKSVANLNIELYGVTYGNNTFVAVGYADKYASPILISSNGVKWKSASFKKGILDCVTYGNSIFVAIGAVYDDADDEIVKNIIITSKNGVKWRTSKPPKKLKQWLPGITDGNSTFVAVGVSGTIITSPDGKKWTIQESGTSASLYDVTYGNSTFVAVGRAESDVGYASVILTSPDGVTWTER